ncbi:hypothetical protein DFJ77DRAFT_280031 [Powellomyces hirtus]|nr:hypothetical protein DFJ77DRAFT_280031 [Powellomyces hirtus]
MARETQRSRKIRLHSGSRISICPQSSPTNLQWFVGDGTVHSVLFKAGAPHYSHRYINSNKYRVESILFAHQSPLAALGSGLPWLNTLGNPFIIFIVRESCIFVRYLTGNKRRRSQYRIYRAHVHPWSTLVIDGGSTPVHIDSYTLETVGNYKFDGQLSGGARAATIRAALTV